MVEENLHGMGSPINTLCPIQQWFEYPVTEGCILNLLFYVEDNDGVISYRYEGFKLVSSRNWADS